MDFRDLLNKHNQNRKAELQSQIEFYKKQGSRSRNYFFANILGAIITTVAAYFLIPSLICLIFDAVKWTGKHSGKLLKDVANLTDDARKLAFREELRMKSLYGLNTALIIIVLLTGLGWVIFRFRKWTEYSYRVKVLQTELDNLENK